MDIVSSLAATFQVSEFDVLFFGGIILLSIVFYYFLTFHQILEAAFGAMV